MARDEGGKGEIAGEGGRGGRETTLGPTVQGEAAGRERKRRRRDGTDGTSRRAHVCVSIYVCMHVHPRVYALSCVSAHICATFDHVCMDALAPVRVHGRSAWSTRIRGVWCTRGEHVCASRSRANVCGCAPPVPRTKCRSMYARGTYVRVCVRARVRARSAVCASRRVCTPVCARTRVNPCVGDDALQTRVKSRGGREFLCASRPVLLLVPSPPPSAATLLSPLASSYPLVPLPITPYAPPRAQLTAVGPFREW